MIDLPLTKPQREFVFSTATNPAIIGGLGSGKTRAGTIRAILKLLEGRGLNVGYYMPTYDLLRLRAMVGLEEDLTALGLKFTTNLSEYTIKVDGYGSIICRSYDRPERIVAYQTAHSVVDEIDTLPKEKAAFVWRKITERNRQLAPTPNSMACVTTPDGGYAGFVYDRWVSRADDSTHLIKAPTASNPYLPLDYIDNIRRNYDPQLAAMYLDGEFVSLTANKVYHYFSRETHSSSRTMSNSDAIHIGLDFNVGGCCAVAFVIDNGNPIAIDEFVSQNTEDVINNIRSRYGIDRVTAYPDASGKSERTNASASDIAMMQNAGIRVDVGSSNPFIRDRINSVNSLLSHGRLAVNIDKCKNFVSAMETQGYDEKGSPEKFNNHPAIDDWVDAAGYCLHRMFPIHKPVTHIPVQFWR